MWKFIREAISGNTKTIGNSHNNMAVQFAASETRIYAVVKTTNDARGLRLFEIDPKGSFVQDIGALFTSANANWECRGLAWDSVNGRLRGLFYDNTHSRSWLYAISRTDASATGPRQLTGEKRGLCFNGTSLVTTALGRSSSETILQLINETDNTTSTLATIPTSTDGNISPGDVSGLAFYDGSYYLMSSALSNHILKRTGSTMSKVQIQTTSISGKTGLVFFGNNLYSGKKDNNTTVSVGYRRNRDVEQVSSSDLLQTNFVSGAMTKRDNNHIYVTPDGANLYELNRGSGTVNLVGSFGVTGITCLVWGDSKLYGIGNNRIYTIDTLSGTATAGSALRTSFSPITGSVVTQGRLTVWNAAGSVQNIDVATGLVSSVGTLAANQGGFYDDGYFFVDGSGNIRTKAIISGSATTLLDPNTFPSGRTAARGFAQVNGTGYTLGTGSNRARLVRYKGLFPEFYARGTVLNAIALPDVQNITKVSEASSTTHILPVAHAGKAPYTYTLTQADGSALPSGMTFNATLRQLTVASSVADGIYTLVYTATDSESPTQSAVQAFRVLIGAEEQGFTSTVPLTYDEQEFNRIQGQAGTVQLAAARGGTSPYSYELGSGTATPGQPVQALGARTNLRAITGITDSRAEIVDMAKHGTHNEAGCANTQR